MKRTKIFVHRGDLKKETLSKIPRSIKYVVVTGDVSFSQYTFLPFGLVALGNLKATKLSVRGDLICKKGCEVSEELKVRGNLTIQKRLNDIRGLTLKKGALIQQS